MLGIPTQCSHNDDDDGDGDDVCSDGCDDQHILKLAKMAPSFLLRNGF